MDFFLMITGIAVSKHSATRTCFAPHIVAYTPSLNLATQKPRTLSPEMEFDLRAAAEDQVKKRGGASAGTWPIPALCVVLALVTGVTGR